MLSPTGWWLAVTPVDLRCGMDRLLVKVQVELGRDARDGCAYAFRNRSGSRMKVVCVDAHGVWMSVRRLHEGGFVWPRAGDALCTLTAQQFAWLSAGVDWQRLSRTREALPLAV
ncbi:MAG: IS66 family insertion sequence element accessory protein TnpB [Dokdonella sp.]